MRLTSTGIPADEVRSMIAPLVGGKWHPDDIEHYVILVLPKRDPGKIGIAANSEAPTPTILDMLSEAARNLKEGT